MCVCTYSLNKLIYLLISGRATRILLEGLSVQTETGNWELRVGGRFFTTGP